VKNKLNNYYRNDCMKRETVFKLLRLDYRNAAQVSNFWLVHHKILLNGQTAADALALFVWKQNEEVMMDGVISSVNFSFSPLWLSSLLLFAFALLLFRAECYVIAWHKKLIFNIILFYFYILVWNHKKAETTCYYPSTRTMLLSILAQLQLTNPRRR
jgi:hypothetical protein